MRSYNMHYNWLTIKTVAEARPDDSAAQETYVSFQEYDIEEHKLLNVEVKKRTRKSYLITYEIDGEIRCARFPVEAIDCFLDQMNREPEKYK